LQTRCPTRGDLIPVRHEDYAAANSILFDHLVGAGERDHDVLTDSVIVGRIMKAMAAPEGTPGYGTLAYGYREDRT
jgi:hypothetical protein